MNNNHDKGNNRALNRLLFKLKRQNALQSKDVQERIIKILTKQRDNHLYIQELVNQTDIDIDIDNNNNDDNIDNMINNNDDMNNIEYNNNMNNNDYNDNKNNSSDNNNIKTYMQIEDENNQLKSLVEEYRATLNISMLKLNEGRLINQINNSINVTHNTNDSVSNSKDIKETNGVG